MFDIGSSELLLVIVVAVVVIGPKDLPRALYKLGQIIGKGKAMTRHFRAGLDAMVREAELEDLEKKWAAQNARIMAEHPPEATAPAEPLADSLPPLPSDTSPVQETGGTSAVSASTGEAGLDSSSPSSEASR